MTIEKRRGAFDSELAIRAVSATTWSLLSPLIWTGTKGGRFEVPVGFVTDFATVPRFLHWLVLPYGPYTRAAVLHDYLLTALAMWEHKGQPEGVLLANSRDCDGIFRRVMEDLGVPWIKRWTMWTAVRWASLFNADRAYGRKILPDLPRMLGISVLVLGNGIIPLAAICVALALGLVRVVNFISSGGRRGRP